MTDRTTALEERVRLAHQARRAREHQLDDIRRALCDIGLMEDGDPYGHADLADVIRQTATAPGPAGDTVRAAVQRAQEYAAGEGHDNMEPLEALGYHASGLWDRAEQAEADLVRVRQVLAEVLATFVHKVPGYRLPRVRSGDVDVVTMNQWRSMLQETAPAPAAAEGGASETPLERRLRFSERRNDELRTECRRRGKRVLEQSETIRTLERQLAEAKAALARVPTTADSAVAREREDAVILVGVASDVLHANVNGVTEAAPAPAATEDSELPAEEARDQAAALSLDLYRAQDALAFVGECCDIADREQRPVTTAQVREWLKGARCGRQLAADVPAPAATEATKATKATKATVLRLVSCGNLRTHTEHTWTNQPGMALVRCPGYTSAPFTEETE
jgi:hypothetical protein